MEVLPGCPVAWPHLVWLHTVMRPTPGSRVVACCKKVSSPSTEKSLSRVSTAFDASETSPSVQERPSSPQGAASACCEKWSSTSTRLSMTVAAVGITPPRGWAWPVAWLPRSPPLAANPSQVGGAALTSWMTQRRWYERQFRTKEAPGALPTRWSWSSSQEGAADRVLLSSKQI